MQISSEAANELVKQQRLAHKFIAGFYQNILKAFDDIAKGCGCEFLGWGPHYTSRPGRSQTNPAEKWVWDFLPLYSSVYDYHRSNKTKNAVKGESVLYFALHCDTAFDPENRVGYIDPLDLEPKDSTVEVLIYRCAKPAREKCIDVYYKVSKEILDYGWNSIGNGAMHAYYALHKLEDFISEYHEISKNIQKMMSVDFKVPLA